MGRREARLHFVAALATPRFRYREHTESSARELAAVEACRVNHLDFFIIFEWLSDAGGNYDLGGILHMSYFEFERIYRGFA